MDYKWILIIFKVLKENVLNKIRVSSRNATNYRIAQSNNMGRCHVDIVVLIYDIYNANW